MLVYEPDVYCTLFSSHHVQGLSKLICGLFSLQISLTPRPDNQGPQQQATRAAPPLCDCRLALASAERQLRRARTERDEQLAALCRQMMGLECGLRRSQRQLGAAIHRRDVLIREQASIIRFLLSKNNSAGDIGQMVDEAAAKIPQLAVNIGEDGGGESNDNVTRIHVSGGEGGIIGSDDSDSAIIADDVDGGSGGGGSGSGGGRLSRLVSRSVSDVTTCDREEEEEEEEEEDVEELDISSHSEPEQYESPSDFSRKGSYERFKVRGKRFKRVTAYKAKPKQTQSINHRSVTKPRDVKNRNSSSRASRLMLLGREADDELGEDRKAKSLPVQVSGVYYSSFFCPS